MSDINGINSTNNIFDELGLTNSKAGKSEEELGQAEFFELMVAQMKNQDPLKPEGNGDFLAQLAQFKMSDGISSMEGSLDALTNSMQSNQALQASSLVGRNVLAPGNTANLKQDGQGIQGVATLPSTANNVTLDVYGSNGALVKQIPLGAQPPGDLNFNWDGTNQDNDAMPAGQYKMALSGLVGTETTQFTTYISSNVDSVSLGNNGQSIKLNIEGIGQLNLSDIKQIGK